MVFCFSQVVLPASTTSCIDTHLEDPGISRGNGKKQAWQSMRSYSTSESQIRVLTQPPDLPKSEILPLLSSQNTSGEWKVAEEVHFSALKNLHRNLNPAPVQLCWETPIQTLRWHTKLGKSASRGRFMSASWQLDAKAIVAEHTNKLSIWKSYSNLVAGGYFGNNSSLGTQLFYKSGLKNCHISISKTSKVEEFN